MPLHMWHDKLFDQLLDEYLSCIGHTTHVIRVLRSEFGVGQGWKTVLESHSPAEFCSNLDKNSPASSFLGRLSKTLDLD